ncbi:MAG: PilZ domain-containing protein [Firmicutes bacterium]|nr:PilZ domain-containing protein [Bacillota bacterium]
MESKAEKRKVTRADYIIKSQARYKDRLFPGEIKNISLNGFLFSPDEVMDISEGDELVISIVLDGETADMRSEINCTVIRKTEKILGLKFNVIDYDTLMLLKERLINTVGDKNRVNDEFINFLLGS